MADPIENLAERLVAAGMASAFGVTGSGASLQLITALEARGVKYYPVAHEAAGAIMAGAVARCTGRVSAAIAIKGPGLANMLGGIIGNHFENHPALSVTECFGDNVPASRMHKRLDHTALLGGVVKNMIALNQVETELDGLLALARAEIPGPVHLDLAMRSAGARAAAAPAVLALGAERRVCENRLQRARRPLLIVGSLATRRPWGARLDGLDLPVFTTAAAKGVVDERRACSAGVFTGAGQALAPETSLLEKADLVIGLGLRNTEVLAACSLGRPTVLLDEVGGPVSDGFQADLVWSNVDNGMVEEVLAALQRHSWGIDVVAEWKARLTAALLTGAWMPAACFDVLNRLPFGYTLALDTGSFCTIGEHLWLAGGTERAYIGSGNGRYMGMMLPAAIGLAAGERGRPVIGVIGDGGIRPFVSEMRLAVAEKLAVAVVLMADGRYGSVACVPQSRPMSTRATMIADSSWAEAMAALGCPARIVESAAELRGALTVWDRRSPLFVETRFDPDAYARMTKELR